MSRNTLTRLAVVLAAIAISVAAVACADDSGESAESAGDEFCSALDTVKDDLSLLEDIDVSVDNASGIGYAVGSCLGRCVG